MNLDLNLYTSEDGFDVCVHSIKLKLPNCHHIYMILFLKVIIITTHKTYIGHLGPYYCRTDVFKYSFFPYTVVEWNKVDADLKNAKSYMCFRNSLLKIGRPDQNSIFKIFNPLGIKFL